MRRNRTPLLPGRPASEGLFCMSYSIGALSGRPAVIPKRFGGPHFRNPRAPQKPTRISLAGAASSEAGLRVGDGVGLSSAGCSMSRRAFKPTAEQRGWVEAMIGYGIPEAEIRLLA